MKDVILEIGAHVRCADGRCGKLIKVVANPETGRVIDLIVEKGLLLKTDRVLPVSLVEDSTEGEIRIALSVEELKEYPEYIETGFVPYSPTEVGGYDPVQMVTWLSPYGAPGASPMRPAMQRKLDGGIPSELEVIGRGTPVRAGDRRVGRLDHLLVNSETGEIGYLVLDTGGESLPIVPASVLERISEEGILIRVDEGQLDEYPQYHPREEGDILDDLRDALEAGPFDFGGLTSAVEDGVLHLSGSVEDVEAKRHAESKARSIAGVVDVENRLDADTTVVARVTAALAHDPHTEVAVIDVACDRGIVTLTGRVDSTEVRQAAEDIAQAQAGVITVVNELEVRPDEHTEGLRVRLLPISFGWSRPALRIP